MKLYFLEENYMRNSMNRSVSRSEVPIMWNCARTKYTCTTEKGLCTSSCIIAEEIPNGRILGWERASGGGNRPEISVSEPVAGLPLKHSLNHSSVDVY